MGQGNGHPIISVADPLRAPNLLYPKRSNTMLELLVKIQNIIAGRKADIDERGATAVEYALMVALIAVVVIGGVTLLGTNASKKFNSAAVAIH